MVEGGKETEVAVKVVHPGLRQNLHRVSILRGTIMTRGSGRVGALFTKTASAKLIRLHVLTSNSCQKSLNFSTIA